MTTATTPLSDMAGRWAILLYAVSPWVPEHGRLPRPFPVPAGLGMEKLVLESCPPAADVDPPHPDPPPRAVPESLGLVGNHAPALKAPAA